MPKTIAITGPESTGKSWLAKKLADHYKAIWVREYAVEYLKKIGLKYFYHDIENIAIGQLKLFEEAKSVKNNYLFCDTEMLVLKIWSEVVFDKCPPIVNTSLFKQNFDLYLLCFPDIDWEFHPLRENPNDRDVLFRIYENELIKNKFPYRIVKGKGVARLQNAITFVDQISSQ